MKIKQFYQEVLKSNPPDILKESISKVLTKSNILILTYSCNLDCDYCYQKEERKSNTFKITENEIHNFVKEIIQREGVSTTSTLVLFGGEPLLYPDLFFKALDIIESYDKKFAISTTTNGKAFLNKEFFKSFQNKIKSLKNKFSLEISYDGLGNYRRGFETEKVLELFNPKEITIRYTIHKGNYKESLRDIIKLCNTGYHKIVVNFYETELQEFVNVDEFKDTLTRQTEYLFTKFKTPICHLNCQFCNGCDYQNTKGINYNGRYNVDGNAGVFNVFTELNNNQ